MVEVALGATEVQRKALLMAIGKGQERGPAASI